MSQNLLVVGADPPTRIVKADVLHRHRPKTAFIHKKRTVKSTLKIDTGVCGTSNVCSSDQDPGFTSAYDPQYPPTLLTPNSQASVSQLPPTLLHQTAIKTVSREHSKTPGNVKKYIKIVKGKIVGGSGNTRAVKAIHTSNTAGTSGNLPNNEDLLILDLEDNF